MCSVPCTTSKQLRSPLPRSRDLRQLRAALMQCSWTWMRHGTVGQSPVCAFLAFAADPGTRTRIAVRQTSIAAGAPCATVIVAVYLFRIVWEGTEPDEDGQGLPETPVDRPSACLQRCLLGLTDSRWFSCDQHRSRNFSSMKWRYDELCQLRLLRSLARQGRSSQHDHDASRCSMSAFDSACTAASGMKECEQGFQQWT